MTEQRRAADAFDSLWIKNNYYVVGVWRCINSDARDLVIEKLCKSFAGFHTYYENGNLVFHKREVPVFKLPENLKTLEEIANYSGLHFARPPSVALGSIAVSEDVVAIVASHSVFDGVLLSILMICLLKTRISQKSESILRCLNHLLSKSTKQRIMLKQFHLMRMQLYNPNDQMQVLSGYSSIQMREEIDAKDFKVYDEKANQIHGIPESIIAAEILTISAMNGKFDKTGVWQGIATRPFAEGIRLTQGEYFAHMNSMAEKVNENDSVDTLITKVKENTDEQVQKGAHWAFRKTMKDSHFEGTAIKGTPPVFFHIGEFKVGGPIKDFLFYSIGSLDQGPSLDIVTYNVKKSTSNIYYLTHTHVPSYFSFRESKTWIESVKYASTRINPSMKIKDAIAELVDLQKNIMKKYDLVEKVFTF